MIKKVDALKQMIGKKVRVLTDLTINENAEENISTFQLTYDGYLVDVDEDFIYLSEIGSDLIENVSVMIRKKSCITLEVQKNNLIEINMDSDVILN
jgi:hypothetical protein